MGRNPRPVRLMPRPIRVQRRTRKRRLSHGERPQRTGPSDSLHCSRVSTPNSFAADAVSRPNSASFDRLKIPSKCPVPSVRLLPRPHRLDQQLKHKNEQPTGHKNRCVLLGWRYHLFALANHLFHSRILELL